MALLRNRPILHSTLTDQRLGLATTPLSLDFDHVSGGAGGSVVSSGYRVAFLDVAILLISIAGFIAILYATTGGPGTGPDSASYVMAAKNVLGGHGLSVASPQTGEPVPMTHFPPLFSLMIAAITLFVHDSLNAVRWLNASLFAGTIFLFGYGLRRIGASPLTAISSACGVFASLPMIFVHTWVLSEALFFFLAFLGLFLLSDFIVSSRVSFLAAASIALGLAWATRYVGITLALTAGISVLFFSRAEWGRRIKYLLGMGLIIALPMIAVVARNRIIGGSMTDRQAVVHPVINIGYFSLALEKIATWLVPAAVPRLVQWALALALIVFAVVPLGKILNIKVQDQRIVVLHKVVLAFTLCYLAVLVATLIFFDADIRIDDRDLSPFYLCGLVMAECQFAVLLASGRRIVRTFAVAVLVVVMLISTPRALKLMASSHSSGLGFSREHWKSSELAKAIRRIDPGDTIVSDSTAGVFFLSGRVALALPYKINAHTAGANTQYAQEMASLADRVRHGRTDFVFFNSYGEKETDAGLIQAFHLQIAETTSDGEIYRTP